MKNDSTLRGAPPVRFVVTAGPTREYLDPVRFLSNPSTGRMGFAVARAARAAGYAVSLVAGPVTLKSPKGVKRVDVVSARDMLAAVVEEIKLAEQSGCQVVLVMTAAVADWRPAECASLKLKKSQMSSTLKLVRNPDILKTLHSLFTTSTLNPQRQTSNVKRQTSNSQTFQTSKHPNARTFLTLIGFAAETGEPTAEAARKCREKGLAMVVANDVTQPGAGFGVKTNRVSFVFPDGRVDALPLMSKDAVARRIVAKVKSSLMFDV